MNSHPRLPGLLLGDEILRDTDERWEVTDRNLVYDTPFVGLSVDKVIGPDGMDFSRAVLQHHGAVGIVVLDEEDNVLVLDQYRHPVGKRLIELPAGILDIEGEPAMDAAKREVREETDIEAATWRSLLRMFASPGCSTEHWEVFLAEGLSPTPHELRGTRTAEEADMRQLWVPLAELIEAVLDSRIGDSMTVSAVLAVHALRGRVQA
ncbi:MAG: NUDIX domain-containing protein [Aeromicrobium sp.]